LSYVLIALGAFIALPQLAAVPGDWVAFWLGSFLLLWGAGRLAAGRERRRP
jgi:hypothetical protein